jgi:GTP cyclohydrolase I
MTATIPDTDRATDAVVQLLRHIGEDPTRDGLVDTPARVVRALTEMTRGYYDDPAEILARTFDITCDEMVVVRRVPFASLCEHHLLRFAGHATVAYIPGDRVVGLSKLARLVDCFAHRLQVQERMTGQIADAIVEHLDPVGAGVIVTAAHSCMADRGVGKAADMVTSALRGAMRNEPSARAELLMLHQAT